MPSCEYLLGGAGTDALGRQSFGRQRFGRQDFFGGGNGGRLGSGGSWGHGDGIAAGGRSGRACLIFIPKTDSPNKKRFPNDYDS